MKGQVIATAQWRRLDGQGEDKCRLVQEPGGWMIAGHARFVADGGHAVLDYVLRGDSDWHCRSADVVGRHNGAEIGLRLLRGADGWHLNGAEAALLPDCDDLDLGFTPACLLFPLRRVADAEPGQTAQITQIASLDFLRPALSRQAVGFVPAADGRVIYRTASHRRIELCVHSSGFITHQPGRWEGAASDTA